MPRPLDLADVEVVFNGGFFPKPRTLRPGAAQYTIRRGSNVWLRPGGAVEVADGLLEVSATNVGARIFAADIQRAVIAGGLVGNRLPFAGLLRYENAALFFLSENTSAQVYLNEVAVSGLITSSVDGRLRVAIPDGVGGYSVFDAGFDPPVLPGANVTLVSGGTKSMSGPTGVALIPWRTTTNAKGPPSNTVYQTAVPTTADLFKVQLLSAVSGQDGWILGGTRVGDTSGELRVVRRVFIVPRGTFTATQGTPNLTAGVNTQWMFDLRPGDVVAIDGNPYTIATVTAHGTATLTANFSTTGGAGKTMTITTAAADWRSKELGALIDRDVFRAPRAAGVFEYANRVFLWGCRGELSSSPTGSAILAMLDSNPEHVGEIAILTASGADLLNVLVGDRQLFLMTPAGLEAVTFTGERDAVYIPRVLAEPGFKSGAGGTLYKNQFYGFSNRPLRTVTEKDVDVEFAAPVWPAMRTWNPDRVVVEIDPENEAVLYIHDNGSSTQVVPWMTQIGEWAPPQNFSARILDAEVVNGLLYVTYLSGGNTRVNQWEGGSGIGGTRYAATQYFDPNMLNRSRLEEMIPVGKISELRVYAALPGQPVPDVSNAGAAAAVFTLADIEDNVEIITTDIEAIAYAFRFEFGANGNFQSMIARGTPRSGGQ